MAPVYKLEVQKVIDRWKVEIEIDTLKDNERTIAFYGYLPTGTRILLGIVQDGRRMRYVDEVIDEYLREANPELAEMLLKDVDTLLSEFDEIANYRFGPYENKGA